MAGPGHGGGHVDHGRRHGRAGVQHGAHALVVVRPVLQREHQGPWRQVRAYRARRVFRIRGL